MLKHEILLTCLYYFLCKYVCIKLYIIVWTVLLFTLWYVLWPAFIYLWTCLAYLNNSVNIKLFNGNKLTCSANHSLYFEGTALKAYLSVTFWKVVIIQSIKSWFLRFKSKEVNRMWKIPSTICFEVIIINHPNSSAMDTIY